MFALLAKYAIEICGEDGKEAILEGMIQYGNERGRRMAQNAVDNGDEPNTATSQIYGEWIPDYPGQMEFGRLRSEPTLRTYISKCAWCDAWKKHNLTEFGKLYCVNVDNAVYRGFQDEFNCTPITTPMSWGGDRCDFDWGNSISSDEDVFIDKRKKELNQKCVKDFTFHTAHIKRTISDVLIDRLGERGRIAVSLALKQYSKIFGDEYLQILDSVTEF